MRISIDAAVRPSRFNDNTLNRDVGKIIGRLSDDDVRALAIRRAEIAVALARRERWVGVLRSIARSAAQNLEIHQVIATTTAPVYRCLIDEFLAYIRADLQQLGREALLAGSNIALCDKVVAALTDPLIGTSHHVSGTRDSSPLCSLQDSAAAAQRATDRVSTANDVWNAAVTAFEANAKACKAFAATSDSVTLTAIDALSSEAFEERMAWLLERDGCTILRRRGGANDEGADVIALTPDGRRVVLQCKHSIKASSRLSPRHVRELNGAARQVHGANIVGIVTNRALTDPARSFALSQRIHVIDRPALQRWATYGIAWLPTVDA